MKRTLLVLLLAASPLAAAEGRELHFKTDMSGPGLPAGLTSETWIKGDRVRMEMQTPIGPSVMVIKDKIVYSKTGGMAMKLPVEMQKGSGPRVNDWATAMDKFLEGGTKVGTETVDGEACEKWHVTRDVSGNKVDQTVWVSPSLRFPRKVVVREQGGEITMRNHDIEKKVTLDDAKFEPDPDVHYMDMSEAMKSLQRPPEPAPKKD